MAATGREQLKTGQRPVQNTVRTFKPGDVLFEEGTAGRELYIIEEGDVGVYKNTPDGAIELAVIQKGGVIGEMSVLDNLPRSATVKAKTVTRALLINQLIFQQAIEKVPAWLNSIIKIVVSRLRDANKRVDQSILRDKERGVISLITLLLPSNRYEFSSSIALDYDLVCVEAYYVCRLRKKDITRLLEQIAKRKIITVEEDTQHKKHVCIRDVEVLQLFHEYLNLKAQQKTFKEVLVPEEAIAVLSNIAYVAQKAGGESDEGTTLSKAALVRDLQAKPDQLERSLLDLRRRGLINIMPAENDSILIFKKETISRIKKIKEWLPQFELKFES